MNKFEYKNLTPFKWFVLENFPFIEADFDALTEWQLFCKLGKEINKIIDSQNVVGTEMEKFSQAFVELQNYVNNYFDNLDVQDEINNKLNEMSEDGTLQEIISAYLNSKAIFGFDNVEEMKNATNLIDGSYAKTLGFYDKNDGGSGFYRIRNVTNKDDVDGGSLIALDNTNLVAELITNGTINIKQYGAKETVNSYYENDISTYLEKCLNKYDEVYIPNGTYYLSSLTMNVNNKHLIGIGNVKIYTNNDGLVFSGTSTEPYINRVRELRIKNINFLGENRVGVGLTLRYFGECYIDDCHFEGLEKGLYLLNGSEFAMNNSILIGNTISLDIYKGIDNDDIDAISINDCAISNSSICVRTDSVRGCTFNNTTISNGLNNIGVFIRSTNANSENINFVNCEMEANSKASIIVGDDGENTYSLQILNIVNSKMLNFGNNIPVITINKLKHLNIINDTFSFSWFPLIEINEYAQNDLQININNVNGQLQTYIKDNRNTYYGIHLPSQYKKLNFFSDMSRSIIEFGANIEPTFNNNKITFSGNGYIEFPLQEFNYKDIVNGIYVVVRGQNVGNIAYVDTIVKGEAPGNLIQKIGDEEIRARKLDPSNATAIRINVHAGTVISMVEIYGSNKQPLPIAPNPYTTTNIIGNPKIGDTVVFTNSNLNFHLGVWNGSSFSTL